MTPDQLAQLLDELGRRLGPSGEYVFRLAVQRVVIEGAMMTGAALVLIAFGAFGGRYLWRWRKTADSIDLDFGTLIGACILALLVGIASVLAYAGILQLLTPEYSALRDILSAIGGAK